MRASLARPLAARFASARSPCPATGGGRSAPAVSHLRFEFETPLGRNSMALEYGPVAVLLTFGVLLGVASLIVAWLIRPSDPYAVKQSTYECGMDPIGPAWSQFYARYYLIALVFVVFDVEAVFLFPWATVFRKLSARTAMGALPLVEVAIFIAILLVGLAYAWRKGDLDWTQWTPKSEN